MEYSQVETAYINAFHNALCNQKTNGNLQTVESYQFEISRENQSSIKKDFRIQSGQKPSKSDQNQVKLDP